MLFPAVGGPLYAIKTTCSFQRWKDRFTLSTTTRPCQRWTDGPLYIINHNILAVEVRCTQSGTAAAGAPLPNEDTPTTIPHPFFEALSSVPPIWPTAGRFDHRSPTTPWGNACIESCSCRPAYYHDGVNRGLGASKAGRCHRS